MIVIVLVASVIIWRRNRWLVFAAAFYAISMFFLWRYDTVKDLSFVADRFLYLSSLGTCLALAVGFEKVDARLSGATLSGVFRRVVIGVTILLGCLTFQNIHAWHDDMSLWTRAIERQPTLSVAYHNRAAIRLEREDFAGAAADFRLAISNFPRNVPHGSFNDSLLGLAKACDGMGKLDEALKYLRGALAYDHADPRNYFQMGYTYSLKNDNVNALLWYKKAVQRDPKNASYFNGLGVTYFRLNRNADAHTAFDHALALDPDFYESRINRGILFMALNDLNAAVADFSKAIELKPENPRGYQQAAQVAFNQKDFWSAVRYLEQADRVSPGNSWIRQSLARAHQALERSLQK